MSLETFDGLVDALKAQGVGQEAAERFARAKFGRAAAGVASASESELADEDEDAHVEEGDRVMLALGFEIVKLSQKRRSKVTEGIPDRKYYHRRRRLTLWWEGKSETGWQRPAQREFQQMAEACGEIYVLGKFESLKTWLVTAGVATRNGEQLEPTPVLPF